MVAQQIREWRRRRRLSQTELAQRLGLRQATISDWERGVYHPTKGNLLRLSGALGVPLDDLLSPLQTAQ